MELIGLVVLLTSTVACIVGARRAGLAWSSLGKAGLRVLETIGLGAVFFGANVVAGVIIIAATRGLTGQFVSPYILGDVGLVTLSMLQGMIVACWYSARPTDPAMPRRVGSAPGRRFARRWDEVSRTSRLRP